MNDLLWQMKRSLFEKKEVSTQSLYVGAKRHAQKQSEHVMQGKKKTIPSNG